MVAVLATIFAMLMFGQSASNGRQAPRATALAASIGPSPGVTARASVADDGSQAQHGGSSPVISGKGRWEIFSSVDPLDPSSPSPPPNQSNIFVRDLQNGTTTQLSLGNSPPSDGSGSPEPPSAASFQPAITDNGRYISFITNATNIVPVTGTSPRTLVVCDRDPDDDGILDEPSATGGLTNVCRSVYSTPSADADAISTFDTPQLEGLDGQIVWTQQSATGDQVWTASTIDAGGVLAPGTPMRLPMLLTTPAGCGIPPSGLQPTQSEPVITDNGSEIIVAVSFPWGIGCTAIVGTANYTQPGFEHTTRYDVVPTGCGTGFIGDGVPLTGECVAGNGGEVHYVNQPTIDRFASSILFHFHDGPGQVSFAAPRAVVTATTDTNWMVLTKFQGGPNYTSQVVSRDNNNVIVDSGQAVISGDGRFLAFETAAPNSHDGADPSAAPGVVNQQVVARDLTVDAARVAAGQSRLPGALVTAHDPSLLTLPTGCAPAADQLCGSANGVVSDLSMDAIGDRVSFADSATDLVPGDTNTSGDAFVRTWQPTLSNRMTTIPPLQAGDSTIVSVPVQISGFGPVVLGTATIGGPDSADFTIEGSTCDTGTFYTGDSCAVSVRFAPDTVGTKTATVSISSAQLGTVTEVATLTGTVIDTGPKSAAGDNTRVSLTNTGDQSPNGGYGGRESMVSGNGRWDVFTSDSEMTGRPTFDPTPTDDSTPQDEENIFVRDLADPQHTVQISLHSDFATHPTRGPNTASRPVAVAGHPTGVGANGGSYEGSISSNGRFVSFYTHATDIVPTRVIGNHEEQIPPDHTLVVCDRDPSGKKDSAGNPILDLPRPGTTVPNYLCYPVESGSDFGDGPNADQSATSKLSGNGTRITWVETANGGDDDQRRVRVATLSTPGGPLLAPTNFIYVPSDLNGFEHGPDRNDESTVEQFGPVLTENGNSVVYLARRNTDVGVVRIAVIETTLPADIANFQEFRFDTLDNDDYLGDQGTSSFDIDPPAVSDDGSRVAFAFRGPDDGDPSLVYVATRSGDLVHTMIASRDNAGNQVDGFGPALSGDGRYLAFVSSQPNSHNGVDPPKGSCFADDVDSGVNCQIVARDLVKDAAAVAANQPWVPSEIVSSSITTTCVAHLPPGRVCASTVENPQNPATPDTTNPSIDATGSEIGFDSSADDIVTGDTNLEAQDEGPTIPATDSFVHTWRPSLATTPAFDFGSVGVGQHRDKTFTVTESGFGPISMGATTIAGANPGDYTLLSTTCTGKTLNDTQQCAMKLRFAPKADGNRKATLSTRVGKNGYPRHNPQNTISYDPTLIRSLTGKGVGATNGGADPSTLNFGSDLPLHFPGKNLTTKITNSGSLPQTITNAVVTDTTVVGVHGDYQVDATDCLGALAPGASCTISVHWVGHAVGSRPAVLTITGSGPTGTTTVGLVATVPTPTVTVNPGVSPIGRPVTIDGEGFAPSRVIDVGFLEGGKQMSVETDAAGTFEVSMVVLGNGPQGPRTVHAQIDSGSSTIAADCPLLVVLGTVDSPDLITRH
jgi:hypothetical protein